MGPTEPPEALFVPRRVWFGDKLLHRVAAAAIASGGTPSMPLR
jgi:hypothetical protein